MDHRDTANHLRLPYRIDEQRGVLLFEAPDPACDGWDTVEVEVTLEWEVCGSCDGRGSYVDPAIDSHGLARDDFDADPDFEESYRNGTYDVRCSECQGRRVTPTSSDPRFEAAMRDAWNEAREDAHAREMGY